VKVEVDHALITPCSTPARTPTYALEPAARGGSP
jgi:hypothetical protein